MKKIFTKNSMQYVFNALLVIAGTFLMGFAFNVFLDAHHISPSGFSGLSSIISNVLGEHLGINISASIFYLGINAILFLLSFKRMGVNFAVNSAIGVVAYSIFMEVCSFDIGLSSSGDLLLYAIYGGVLMGIGLGLVFRGHGSTGGSDMLANILGKKFKFMTVGNLVLIVDFIVVALSFIAYGDLKLALYSLVSIWIMTKLSDVIVAGVQGVRAYYIVSTKYEQIAKEIMTKMQRGVTGLSATGMYTGKESKMLIAVVTRSETVRLRHLVASIDKNAFMYSTSVSEAMGQGFLPLKAENEKTEKNVTAEAQVLEQQISLEQVAISQNETTRTVDDSNNTVVSVDGETEE